MMRYKLTFLFILCLIGFQYGYAQQKKNNTVFDIRLSKFPTPDFSALKAGGSTVATVAELNHDIDSAFKMNKSYDFEFRLWELPLSSFQVFVLRYSGGKWSARRFAETKLVNNVRQFGEQAVSQQKLTQLWYLLDREQVLTLPPESALKPQLTRYAIDTATLAVSHTSIEMTDGILYVYELRTPDKYRVYHYGSPYFTLRNYPNVEDLYHATMITLLINKYRALSTK